MYAPVSFFLDEMPHRFVVCITSGPGGGGGATWINIFAGYVPLASQNPYPIMVYSVAYYRPHLSHSWANIIFRSQLSHVLFMPLPSRAF